MTPPTDSTREQQARLFAALKDPACFGDDVARVDALETHISYVLLTSHYAYKLKKSVDFGFLDFTTLEARRFYCSEELRLNRRLAPALYLDVVPITGSVDRPRIGGDGPALEYAVKMRQFAQEALGTSLLSRDEISPADVDGLAATVAGFHAAVERAAPESGFGASESIEHAALDNCGVLRNLAGPGEERDEIEALARWTEHESASRRSTFRARLDNGFVRECHGDLHLGNVARIDGRLTIFDCIEFNPALRWIDVMNEVAFTVMDLEYRGRTDLARRFLNAYLEITGDYAGLAVLRFYLVYRALVRAKVARLRAVQLDSPAARRDAIRDSRAHERLASAYASASHPAIVITHGFSGSGKTTLSQALLERLSAVRVRSDVERKRLAGVEVLARDRGGIDQGLYGDDATEATYARLATLAREIVESGLVAVVDAAFLKRRQRSLLRQAARELKVPFVVVDFAAAESVLRARVADRARLDADASDADLAVLEHQLREHEPFTPDELNEIVCYDANGMLGRARAADAWRDVRARIETALQPA